MPVEFLYLAAVFVVAILGFTLLKRPLYECMFVAFIVLVAITNSWTSIWDFIWKGMKDSSLYVIIVFIISASLLSKTSVIDDFIAIILGIFGRMRGGAGFVAIIGSTYMGSLSGSGPGNVATTGVFTIPAMMHSGFPAHLAANVEAHSSTMGNMIPPAGMIATAFAILDGLYPEKYTISQYWLLLWGVAIWFIAQRIITMYFMCRYYKVEPMKKEDIPNLKESLKNGWKAIFLPIIVFVPFILTSKFEGWFKGRLGKASSNFTSSLLLFIPALIVVVAILLSKKETKKKMTLPYMYNEIKEGLLKVVPTASLVLFAYFVSNVLVTLGIEQAIGDYIASLNMSLFALALILPLFTAILGMLIPGSTQVKIFGGIIITVVAAAGGNPMLACAMLPCICGAMHGVTPPYCACVYTGMGIANAELKPTLTNCMVWIAIHYVLSVITMMGWLPLIGLIK
ncbi:MAG: TRAP transporter large permease subunit [Lachnospiraceae bacterium]|nr:TRAP transporter large permease subunit [Lachnospiraceae bacterium]